MKRKNIFVQSDISSCGACSIASVVSYYGGYVPLEKIKEDSLTDKSGTNAYEIVRTLRLYGFSSYGLKISLEKLNKDLLPVIAHIRKDGYEHFLVIYDYDSKSVLTMDPAYGKKTYSKNEFLQIFSNTVIVCNPNGSILKLERKSSLKKFYMNIFRKEKFSLIKLTILSIFVILLSLFTGFYLKIGSISNNLTLITLIFIFLIILKYILLFLKSTSEMKLSFKIKEDIHKDFIKHIFKLKLKYLSSKRVGEIVQKITDMSEVENLFMNVFLIYIFDLLLLIIGSIIMSLFSIHLFILFIANILTLFIITIVTSGKIYKKEKKVIFANNSYSGNLVEYLEGIESIKNLNKVDEFLDSLNDSFKSYLDSSFKLGKYNIFCNIRKNLYSELCFILINATGLYMISKGSFGYVDLITFNTIYSLSNSSFENLLKLVPNILHVKAVFRSLSEFLDVEEEKVLLDYKEPLNRLKVDNLCYSYDLYHNTLNNFNLEINMGDKLLVNGASGVGKSTFVKCLSGILDNYKGNVFMNEIDIKNISIKSLREYIIYVGQEETLFSTNILDNICLYDYNEELFNEIIEITGVSDIISKRAQGEYNAILEGGSNFSGGERARIILARALYKKPKVLILDETLSSVNAELEDEILKRLLSLDNLTLIYITHRDKTALFENVLFFRKDGTYEIRN